MKLLCLVAAAAMLLTVAVPTQATGPRDYVRMLGDRACSGVVIQPGLVLTASHCVAAPSLEIAGTAPTVVANGDDRLDYALLRFPDAVVSCPCAPISDREAERDESLVIVGFPIGIGVQVLTRGDSQGVQDNPHLPFGRRLVTTVPVAGGNSGGGVFAMRDGDYMLVGLLVEAQGHISFAIPLADLRPFIVPHIHPELR